MLKKILDNSFNIKFALISAPVNGIIAAAVNCRYSILEMASASGTQAVSSFISTGLTARLVQHFSPIKNPITSYSLGSIIPAAATFFLSYGGHAINQTPERLESCIAPTLISLVTSLGTNYMTRRGFLRPDNYPLK